MKYLIFNKQPKLQDKKTDNFHVHNILTSKIVGKIFWNGGFRKYIFAPESNFIFDAGCLKEIAKFLSELMIERKKSKL